MSMSKPIVASAEALEGISSPVSDNLWERSTPTSWAEQIIFLLEKSNKVEFDTHTWVKANYSWEAHLDQIDVLMKSKQSSLAEAL